VITMTSGEILHEIPCPGCGLALPHREFANGHAYYNASRECWLLYAEVLGTQYSDAVLFGHAHQLTVDAYAVQHAGGAHPDKSVGIHLCGLYLLLERGYNHSLLPPLRQSLATSIGRWPRFTPPTRSSARTIVDLALAGSPTEHIAIARDWAAAVWAAWADHHAVVAALVSPF
jgi:hypothetical protein